MFALKIILPRKANSQLSIRLLESKDVRVEWFSEFDSTLNHLGAYGEKKRENGSKKSRVEGSAIQRFPKS